LTLPLIRSAGDALICFKCVLLVAVDMVITRSRWPLLGGERRWGPISTESVAINDVLYREIKSIWMVWDEETRSGDGWILWLSVQEMAMVPCYSFRPDWMGIWNREHSIHKDRNSNHNQRITTRKLRLDIWKIKVQSYMIKKKDIIKYHHSSFYLQRHVRFVPSLAVPWVQLLRPAIHPSEWQSSVESCMQQR
jgi:hypothetical protein